MGSTSLRAANNEMLTVDESGFIDEKEFQAMVMELGHRLSDEQMKVLLYRVLYFQIYHYRIMCTFSLDSIESDLVLSTTVGCEGD